MPLTNYPSYSQPQLPQHSPPAIISKLIDENSPKIAHYGLADYMGWGENEPRPSGLYHPFYNHHIRDNFNSGRHRMNSASIELGVGRHIAEVARYANANNLGSPYSRVGTAYIKNIGFSGQADWYNDASGAVTNTFIHDRLVCNICKTDNFVSISGIFNDAFMESSSSLTSGYMAGANYIPKIYHSNSNWSLDYGNVYTIGYLSFFSNKITTTPFGQTTWNVDQDLYVDSNIIANDLLFIGSSSVSGNIDTFRPEGVIESNITYDTTTGHNHEAGYWSDRMESMAFTIPGTEDSNYYYMLSSNKIYRYDKSSTGLVNKRFFSYIPYKKLVPNNNTRLVFDGDDYAIFGNEGIIWAKYNPAYFAPSVPTQALYRGFIYDGKLIYSVSKLSHKTGLRTNTIESIVDNKGTQEKITTIDWDSSDYIVEAFKIGKLGYFITRKYNIYMYDGINVRKVGDLKYSLSELLYTWVWKNELMFLMKNGFVYRFNRDLYGLKRTPHNYGISYEEKTRGPYRWGGVQLVGIIPQKDLDESESVIHVQGVGAALYIQYARQDTGNTYIHAYSYKKDMTRLNGGPIIEKRYVASAGLYPTMHLYGNREYIHIQLGTSTKKMLRNVSSALSFDAIKGEIILPTGSITVNGEFNYNDNILRGRVPSEVLSNVSSSNYIDNERYLLEPGRSTETAYNYKGDFSDTYIDRYWYNTNNPELFSTYSDITTIDKIGNNTFLGHRGGYTLVQKDSNRPTTATLNNKIPVRFLKRDGGDFILAQDFNAVIPPTFDDSVDTPFETEMAHIPNLISDWHFPKTKILDLYGKDLDAINNFYGQNIIDAISHNDSIYILANENASGIICYKHSAQNMGDRSVTSFSGHLELNESITTIVTNLYDWVIDDDNNYMVDGDGNYVKSSSDALTGFHRFYLCDHAHSPYIIHHKIETLHDRIGPNGITYSVAGSPNVDNANENKYNYNVMEFSFADNGTTSVNKPFAKLIISKDNSDTKVQNIEDDTREMSKLSREDRKSIRFITSVSHNKNIYTLIQTDKNHLTVYKITDLNEYDIMTSDNVKLTFGDTQSVIGDNLNRREIGENFVTDFDPTAIYQNQLVCKINISKYLGIDEEVRIYGDNDDMFIQNNDIRDFRLARRFASTSYVVANNVAYIPILARFEYPNGPLHSIILQIYGDGVVRLTGGYHTQEVLYRSTGRAHILNDRGSLRFIGLKLDDAESEQIAYNEIQNDTVKQSIEEDIRVLGIPENDASFPNRYNTWGRKRLLIGEYDFRSRDVLNIKENL